MNVFERIASVIKNGTYINLKLNKKMYGVQCKVYYPKSGSNVDAYKNFHYEDNYNEEPDLEDIFLIPKVYGWNYDNNFINDPLTDDEVVCYIESNILIPLYSKFEIELDNIQNKFFYVDKIENFQTTSTKIIKKLYLVPLINKNITDTYELEEINDLIEDYNEEKEDMNFEDDYDIKIPTEQKIMEYNPVK